MKRRRGAGRRRNERRARKVVKSSAQAFAWAQGAEDDFVVVTDELLSLDPLSVHVAAVEAAEITQDPRVVAILDHAVLFRDNLVEELDRVVRVTSERVCRAQIN